VFSGIIQTTGTIVERADTERDTRIAIAPAQALPRDLRVGDSIAVSGVCLTVTEYRDGRFAADVSRETLELTTLGELGAGSRVNLEPALKVGDSLDGHFVTGHVDGIGRVRGLSPDGRSLRVELEVPGALGVYVARKGSIAVDGVSLTVNTVQASRLTVNIVPHTRETTIISGYREGTAVNIEVDIIARYLQRLASWTADAGGVDMELLRKYGYTVEE
jgi:riboflavin synthase